MSMAVFLAQAILISLSGALSPGPMTAVTIGKGSESPHAGAFIAVGHGIVEFPLMIAIFFGIAPFLTLPTVKALIALLGGAMLVVMGIGMARSAGSAEMQEATYGRSPIVAGILLAAANPYLIVWWATVGAALIVTAADYGAWAFVIFMLLHWCCDFAWYYFLSFMSYRGGRVFGGRFIRILTGVCGVLLVVFGAKFAWDGIAMLWV
ncbi:MAG TPA: LysE family transporter [Spirochaetota bacterium]|nr:LysE family transporter [Spirochaetota bacterium]